MPKDMSDDWLSKFMRGDDVPDPNHDLDSHADSLHSLQKFTAIADRRGRLQFAAEAAIKGMGYEERDLLHKPFWEATWFKKSEESRQAVRKSVLGALDGKSSECRVQVFTKDGDPVSVTFNVTPLKGAEGDVVAIVAETDPLFAEPTAHHQDLHEEPGTSTEGLSSILDLMEEGYLEADSADGLTMISPSAARLLGYQSPQDMMGKKTADLWTSPALRDKFLVELSRKGKMEKLRARFLCKDHTEISVELKAQLTLNAQGDVVGSRLLFRPTSDQADPETEKRFRGLLQNPLVMVFVVDARGTFLDASESAVRQLGYTLESLRKLDYADLVHPDDRPTMLAAHMELVNKGHQDQPVEMRLKTASGEELWVATCGAPVGERAEDQRFICMALDVTQRKRMEEELVLIKKAVESSSEAIGMSDPKGIHFYHNKAFTDLFEYTPEELDAAGGGPAAYADPKVAQEVFGRIMNGQSWSGETVMVSKSGRHFSVSSIADAIKDDAGNIVGLIGMFTDITERKKAAEDLQKSEEQFRVFAATIHDIIWRVDNNLRFTYVTPSVTIQLGFTVEETLGRSLESMATPESFREVLKLFAEQSEIDKLGEADPNRWVTLEAEFYRKSGGTYCGEVKATFIRDAEGRVIGAWGVTRDIGERKKAEEALRKSEERYRLFAETIHDVIWTTNTELKVTYISPSVFHETGYTVEEAMAQTMDQKMTPASLQSLVKLLGERLELEETGTADPSGWTRAEVEMYRKDGSTFWGEMLVAWQRDSEGHMTGLLGVTRDITERKRASEALEEAERRYRAVFDNPLNIVFILSTEDVILEANDYALQRFGLSHERLGKISIAEIIHPDYLLRALEYRQQSLAGGQIGHSIELRMVSASGEEVWVETWVVKYSKGDITYGLGFARDITAYKTAERALKESEARLKELVEKLRLSQDALSTPVVQIWDKVLALPLIGVIDDQRAQQIMEIVLRKIVESQSELLIMDVTGVASLDTHVTCHLVRTIQSASLLGARCILTGIRPEVAQSVVNLGLDMNRVIVRRDLQDGLRWALAHQE